MASITIPENVRPALAALAKYRFWILAALVPPVLVPLLLVGAAGIRERITAQRRQIDAKLGQAKAVMAVPAHPNEAWQAAIEADTKVVERETFEEWQRFWHSQSNLRQWPADLGEAFLADVARLQPGGKLDRQSLVRYQNVAPRLARSLPAQMGVEDAMGEPRPEAGRLDTLRPGAAATLAPVLAWNPANQARVYESFVWQNVPNTTQVLMAQEELWVYGLFCRLLAGFVAKSTGAHDSPLTFVDELLVGFPVNAGADPSAPQQQQRILLPKTADVPPGEMPLMELPGTEGPVETPWHPRFTGGGGQFRGEVLGQAEQPAMSADDAYRGWVYVDFAGKPLSAAELAAMPAMRMVHLMPFVLRVVVDQRELDRLLTMLAESPIPIDVRQVRINDDAGDAGAPGGLRDEAGGGLPGLGVPPGGTKGEWRPDDVIVELRGSVALAVQPGNPGTVESTP